MSNFASISQLRQAISRATKETTLAPEKGRRMPWEQNAGSSSQPATTTRDRMLSETAFAQLIKSIEATINNFDAFKDNYHYYKMMTSELTTAFDAEKTEVDLLTKKLLQAEAKARDSQDRAIQAEARLAKTSSAMGDLERDLDTLQRRFDKLTHWAQRLVRIDQNVEHWDVNQTERLAA